MNKREKRKFDKQIGDGLWEIVEEMIAQSGGRLRLAFQERDESEDSRIGAGHFLKLDKKRLGQDIENYIFLGHQYPPAWHSALNQFIIEIIFPLNKILPESYTKAVRKVNKLREKIYLRNCRQ